MADERHDAPGRDVEIDVGEHRPVRQVLERDVLEADLTRAGRQVDRAGPVGDLLGLVHDLEDALARRGRPLELADPHAERAERRHEHREVEVERDEGAGAERAVRDHARPGEQDGRLRDERHERDERHVERALPVRLERPPEHGLGAEAELLLLGRLLRERLHDVDADDVLLGDRRDVGEPLLHVAERRMRHVAVAVGEHDERRRDRDRDEGELPLEEEEDAGHRDDGEHVLEEEDEPVAEEEADALEVDGRPRHQLAGLVAVVEAEREPDEVRVEAVPQVELDAERLLARDEAAARHQQGADEPEADDQPDRHPERVMVVRAEPGVDDVLRHPDERDLRRLRPDREQRGDDQAVRYGLRNPSRRTKVVRYGTALTSAGYRWTYAAPRRRSSASRDIGRRA